MKILGIDPGTRRIGYGVIEKNGSALALVEAGLLPIIAKDAHKALIELKRGMDLLIIRTKPQIAAVENIFFSKNQKTAIRVAEARGIILLSLVEFGIRIYEYAPNEIKMSITGHGQADKAAVAKMVRLSIKIPQTKMVDDVTDAIAIAICAAQKERCS